MGPPPHAASPAARSWVSARSSDRGLDEACAAAGVSDSRRGGGTTHLSSSSLLPPLAASERSANARNSCEAKPSRKQKPASTRHAGAFGASISSAHWTRSPPRERVSSCHSKNDALFAQEDPLRDLSCAVLVRRLITPRLDKKYFTCDRLASESSISSLITHTHPRNERQRESEHTRRSERHVRLYTTINVRFNH